MFAVYGNTAVVVGEWGDTSIPGVVINAGVKLTDGMRRWLSVLRSALSSNISITVTSGIRTSDELKASDACRR
jgi:hypothetical protein